VRLNCPACTWPISPEDADCPGCGEVLRDDLPAAPSPRALSKLALLLLGIAGGSAVLALVLLPGIRRAKAKSDRTSCSNNLRQLGFALICYSDDKRFYPHVRRYGDLDGDHTSNHTPKAVRTLLFYGYHDTPGGFVCPASADEYAGRPIVRAKRKTWFWGAAANPGRPDTSPLYDGAPDPALDQTTELSYAYTRKGFNVGLTSIQILAGDRAVRDGATRGTPLQGNHRDGWNLLFADVSVRWYPVDATPPPGEWLHQVDPAQVRDPGARPGYLPVKPHQ
jgi:hypothetical protein